jgi:cysteine-rich repeat protein
MAGSRTRIRVCVAASAVAVVFVVGEVASDAWADCGDGVVEAPGEQCDDGNVDDGDCCSSACDFEADGAMCNTSDLCYSTALATCDGSGTCLARYVPTENFDAVSFVVSDSDDSSTESVRWKRGRVYLGGLPIGDPTATTRYAFCVYAGVEAPYRQTPATVFFSREIPTGSQCCPERGSGWRFRGDKTTAGGLRAVSVGGREGRHGSFASFRVASRAGLGLPGPIAADRYFDIEPYDVGVVVGLVNDEGLNLLVLVSGRLGEFVRKNSATKFNAHIGFLD